jgi:hypothetical protein
LPDRSRKVPQWDQLFKVPTRFRLLKKLSVAYNIAIARYCGIHSKISGGSLKLSNSKRAIASKGKLMLN